jgi:hypothetical protein
VAVHPPNLPFSHCCTPTRQRIALLPGNIQLRDEPFSHVASAAGGAIGLASIAAEGGGSGRIDASLGSAAPESRRGEPLSFSPVAGLRPVSTVFEIQNPRSHVSPRSQVADELHRRSVRVSLNVQPATSQNAQSAGSADERSVVSPRGVRVKTRVDVLPLKTHLRDARSRIRAVPALPREQLQSANRLAAQAG